jgi:hypothetical protein
LTQLDPPLSLPDDYPGGEVVAVTGGRDFLREWAEQDCFDILDEAHLRSRIRVLIHGNAAGLDKTAGKWARKTPGVIEFEFDADWGFNGDAAGPRRNRQMLRLGKPDVVIAFPGGAGTRNMKMQTKRERPRVPLVVV